MLLAVEQGPIVGGIDQAGDGSGRQVAVLGPGRSIADQRQSAGWQGPALLAVAEAQFARLRVEHKAGVRATGGVQVVYRLPGPPFATLPGEQPQAVGQHRGFRERPCLQRSPIARWQGLGFQHQAPRLIAFWGPVVQDAKAGLAFWVKLQFGDLAFRVKGGSETNRFATHWFWTLDLRLRDNAPGEGLQMGCLFGQYPVERQVLHLRWGVESASFQATAHIKQRCSYLAQRLAFHLARHLNHHPPVQR